MRALSVALAAVVWGLAACEEGPTAVVFEVIEEVTFAPSLGVDLTQMTKLTSGVYVQDRVVGTGALLVAGGRAWTSYTGWLRTGVPFDMGAYNFYFRATPPQVVEGWDAGLEGMAVGGTRLLVVPHTLGYGVQDYGVIPGGSILIFEVELDSISA